MAINELEKVLNIKIELEENLKHSRDENIQSNGIIDWYKLMKEDNDKMVGKLENEIRE